MTVKRINVDRVARLPAFSHATVAGDYVHVSGTLGTAPGKSELVPGGVGPETTRVLENMAEILSACGLSFADVVKINVYLRDMESFEAMNRAYIGYLGEDGPARITVGQAGLALDAAVEMDCVAYRGA